MRLNKRRRDVGASGALGGHNDRYLAAARVLVKQHTPTSAELKLARHMAQDGASLAAIHAALGWDCHLESTRARLRKFNIFSRASKNGKLSPKFGGDTGCNAGGTGRVDMTFYRPKAVRP